MARVNGRWWCCMVDRGRRDRPLASDERWHLTMLGLSYAACLPERVSELVLVGCGTYDLTTRRLLVQTIDERLGEEGRRQMADLQQRIEQEQEQDRRDVLLGELGAAHMKIETYEAGDDGPEPEPALPPDHVGHHETWNDVLRLQQAGVEPARFRAISARVLMLHGDFDPHPGKRTFELLQELVPHLEFMELTRCGHEPWRERHARASFVKTLVRWLDRKPA